MTRKHLIRAWLMLVLLTAVSTALHFSSVPEQITGCLILAMAGLKARLILLDYLELRGVQGWSSGLQWIFAGYLTLLAVLFVAA